MALRWPAVGHRIQPAADLVAGYGEIYPRHGDPSAVFLDLHQSGGVDANDTAKAVHNRAAAVAWCDGGVGLEVIGVFKDSVG